MSYTVIYSDYNGLPGASGNYDFRSGGQLPLLPDVDLYNSFNFEIKATSVNANAPSTQRQGAGPAGRTYSNSSNYATTGVRNGTSTRNPNGATAGVHIVRVPVAMRWVDTGGPDGDGIAQNERGDWFSREVLGKADGFGGGVQFVENPHPGGTTTLSFITKTADYEDAESITVSASNSLSIAGSYNNAVFCYNEFGYTDDYEGGTYEVNSLFELPEQFDNLFKFIPDDRETTTLTMTIEVDWVLTANWGIYSAYFTQNQKDSMLSRMGYSGLGDTGTDIHTVTHVINNTNDWRKIFNEVMKRQRSLDEQHDRYGQTFPDTQIEITLPTNENGDPIVV